MNTKCRYCGNASYGFGHIPGSSAKMFLASVFAAAIALSASAGETRYFSNDGDDGADGKTPQTAWASLEKLPELPSGGTALLRRGDVFCGMLRIPAGTGKDGPTTIGAYGEGSRPVVTALKAIKPEAWRESGIPGVWQVDLGDAANFTGNKMSLDGNVGYLKTDGTMRYAKKFRLDDLDEEWDFCDDRRILSVKTSASPRELAERIEVATDDHLLPLKDHIAVRDIEFRGTGSHGANGSARDVVIDNCVFREIGGSRLYGFMDDAFRYGNGIEFWTDSSDATITRCRFADIYDTAFTMQGPSPETSWADIHVTDCVFDRVTQAIELWTTGCPAGVGFERCSFERNICRDTGRGWGYDARPNKEVAVPLLAYMLETDVCDVLVASNLFVNSRGALVYKLGGIDTLPEGYRLVGNETIDDMILETDTLLLAFSRENGALCSVGARETGWTVHARPELGMSWKLLVPVGNEIRDNPVEGLKQKNPLVEQGEGFVRFTWDGVVSERAGALDIKVVQEIRSEGADAVWRTRIENRSPYVVESVHSPIVGDLKPPAGSGKLVVDYPSYAQAGEFNLYPVFDCNQGDYGIEHPLRVQFGPSAVEPFNLIHDGTEGLYFGVKEKRWENIFWFYELLPAYANAMSREVPKTDALGGETVHMTFAAVHQPYVAPGETKDLAAIKLEAYRGGWEDGADVYKRWMRTVSKSAAAPDWAREPHSWLQVHVNSPEDELRYRFRDIPGFAAECAAHGVKAIQLVGWNDGGQDRGNPSHDFDPRLGTWDELKAAVEACDALGVKLVMFSKFTWADRSRVDFASVYEPLAIADPYGGRAWYPGYAYFTLAQYAGINMRRFSPMCFAAEDYLAVCDREFAKIAALNAPGTLYDECQHHGGALACFDVSHGHPYGWCVYANDCALVSRLKRGNRLRDDFLFAGEACYDWEFEEYALAYFRSRYAGHMPLQRYIRPEVQLMTAIVGFDDRDMVDQCLMDRYVMSYEPRYFHGRLGDFPDTLEYGKKMDATRKDLRKWLWDGEFRGRQGASVLKTDGLSHPYFSRFEAADGTSMLVIANYSDDPVEVFAKTGGAAVKEIRAVGDDGFTAAGKTITVAPHSALVAR